MRALAEELESLGGLLGDDHDLFLLAEFAREKSVRAGGVKRLKDLILRRQRELRAAALKAGGQFYSKKPNRFCSRMGDFWKSWREK